MKNIEFNYAQTSDTCMTLYNDDDDYDEDMKIKLKNNLDLDLVKFANILENELSRNNNNSSSNNIEGKIILQIVDRISKNIPEKVKNLEFYKSLPEQLTERQKILLLCMHLQQQESSSSEDIEGIKKHC